MFRKVRLKSQRNALRKSFSKAIHRVTSSPTRNPFLLLSLVFPFETSGQPSTVGYEGARPSRNDQRHTCPGVHTNYPSANSLIPSPLENTLRGKVPLSMPEFTNADLQELSVRIETFKQVLDAEHKQLERHTGVWYERKRAIIGDIRLRLDNNLRKLTSGPEEDDESDPEERYKLLCAYMDHVELTELGSRHRQSFDEFDHYWRRRERDPTFDSFDEEDTLSRLQRMESYAKSRDSTQGTKG